MNKSKVYHRSSGATDVTLLHLSITRRFSGQSMKSLPSYDGKGGCLPCRPPRRWLSSPFKAARPAFSPTVLLTSSGVPEPLDRSDPSSDPRSNAARFSQNRQFRRGGDSMPPHTQTMSTTSPTPHAFSHASVFGISQPYQRSQGCFGLLSSCSYVQLMLVSLPLWKLSVRRTIVAVGWFRIVAHVLPRCLLDRNVTVVVALTPLTICG